MDKIDISLENMANVVDLLNQATNRLIEVAKEKNVWDGIETCTLSEIYKHLVFNKVVDIDVTLYSNNLPNGIVITLNPADANGILLTLHENSESCDVLIKLHGNQTIYDVLLKLFGNSDSCDVAITMYGLTTISRDIVLYRYNTADGTPYISLSLHGNGTDEHGDVKLTLHSGKIDA